MLTPAVCFLSGGSSQWFRQERSCLVRNPGLPQRCFLAFPLLSCSGLPALPWGKKTDKRALRPTMGAWIWCRTSLCKLAYFDLSYTNRELNFKTISGGFTSSCYTLEKLCNCHPDIIPFVPWFTLTISFVFKIWIPLRHLKMGVVSVTVLLKCTFLLRIKIHPQSTNNPE